MATTSSKEKAVELVTKVVAPRRTVEDHAGKTVLPGESVQVHPEEAERLTRLGFLVGDGAALPLRAGPATLSESE
jgi:hypothetical protein